MTYFEQSARDLRNARVQTFRTRWLSRRDISLMRAMFRDAPEPVRSDGLGALRNVASEYAANLFDRADAALRYAALNFARTDDDHEELMLFREELDRLA